MTGLELGIVTDDAEALVRFYTAGFGFEVLTSMTFPQGTVHRLCRDAARMKIYQPSDGAVVYPPAEPWHRDAGRGYGALLVDDAAVVVERASAAGATVLVPVTAHRPGACFALVRDPQGNVWEILQEDS